MIDMREQAITGLIPPQVGEATIRESWPSVTAFPLLARLGRVLLRSVAGAPLGWLVLAPAYFVKILPLTARRYRLTNRRLLVLRGWSARPAGEVPLEHIEEVRLQKDDNSDFFRAATLEILSVGQVVLTLPGVSEAEGFRLAILQAVQAWAPRKRDEG